MTRADIRTLQDDHPMPEYVDSSGCLRTVDYRLFRASVGKATKSPLSIWLFNRPHPTFVVLSAS